MGYNIVKFPFEKKMFFVFSHFVLFWSCNTKFSVPSRIYIEFFLFERASLDAGVDKVIVLIKLCFLLYIQTIM